MLQVIATRCAPGYRGHCVFFFKQKSAYEMRISDWSSDVCSSDLLLGRRTAALIAVSESEADLVRGLRLVDPRRLHEIGRASCRERVCQVRVDLGGRRIIKIQRDRPIPSTAESLSVYTIHYLTSTRD